MVEPILYTGVGLLVCDLADREIGKFQRWGTGLVGAILLLIGIIQAFAELFKALS